MTTKTIPPPTEQDNGAEARPDLAELLDEIGQAEAELADLRARLAAYASNRDVDPAQCEDEGWEDSDEDHLYGFDPDDIEDLVRELPKDLADEIHAAAIAARPLAWLMLELVQRHRQLWDRLIDFYWKDTEKTSEGGDLLNAIAVECGLGVVDDVLGGLVDVIGGPPRARERAATAMRRHAADHYREIGTPAVVELSRAGSASVWERLHPLAEDDK